MSGPTFLDSSGPARSLPRIVPDRRPRVDGPSPPPRSPPHAIRRAFPAPVGKRRHRHAPREASSVEGRGSPMSTSPTPSTSTATPSAPAPGSSRRRLLAAGGLGGLLLAGTAAVGSASASSDDDRHGAGSRDVSMSVPNVAALLRMNVRPLEADAMVLVAGYHAAGDGGAMVVRWDPRSRLAVNG